MFQWSQLYKNTQCRPLAKAARQAYFQVLRQPQECKQHITRHYFEQEPWCLSLEQMEESHGYIILFYSRDATGILLASFRLPFKKTLQGSHPDAVQLG